MAEKFSLLVIIKKKIDSRTLYEKLKDHKMNVADLEDQIMVYNFAPATFEDITVTLLECSKSGKIEVMLSESAN